MRFAYRMFYLCALILNTVSKILCFAYEFFSLAFAKVAWRCRGMNFRCCLDCFFLIRFTSHGRFFLKSFTLRQAFADNVDVRS